MRGEIHSHHQDIHQVVSVLGVVPVLVGLAPAEGQEERPQSKASQSLDSPI